VFSSRRRHTRLVSDWSSDVCSSDLCEWYWRGQTVGKRMLRLRVVDRQGLRLQPSQIITRNLLRFVDGLPAFYMLGGLTSLLNRQIGRASCRERVENSVGEVHRTETE